jgi:hypothetical protein
VDDAFLLDARGLPDEVRLRVVDDVTRAWRRSRFEIRLVAPSFDWDSADETERPPWVFVENLERRREGQRD